MRFCLRTFALVVVVILGAVSVASAQTYPLPGNNALAPVLCYGCVGTNASGQPNDGLKTWPFSPPITSHVGRIVDTTRVSDFQSVFRTARSRKVMIAPGGRGLAGPRVYMQIGSAFVAYDLDRFFNVRLPGGMSLLSDVILKKIDRASCPEDRVLPWDAWVYPELNTKVWSLPVTRIDGQDRMYDFDYDDRGNVYLAMAEFGLGIARDNGETTGFQLGKASQIPREYLQTSPKKVVSLRIDTSYYAAISNDANLSVFDVSNAGAPGYERVYAGAGMLSWAKDEARQRIAIVTPSLTIAVYDYRTFIAGEAPLQTFVPPTGKFYKDVTADEDGNFWSVEGTTTPSKNRLVKLARGLEGYTLQTFDVLGGNIGINKASGPTVNYGAGHLTVMCTINAVTGTGIVRDVRLFRIEGGMPVLVPTDFFRNYYYNAPFGYAQPGTQVNLQYGVYPMSWGGRTYLIFSSYGIGDVFELQTGALPGAIEATPASLRLDAVNGSSRSGVVTVKNNGAGTLRVSSVSAGSAPFSVQRDGCGGAALAPNGTCSVTVTYTRDTTGQARGNLSLVSDDPDHHELLVDLTGDELRPPALDAIAASPTAVHVTWTASSPAVRLEKSSDGVVFLPLAQTAATSFDDLAIVPSHAYEYRAVGLESDGLEVTGNVDLVLTTSFTDDPIVPGVTQMKAAHFAELRDAVGALLAIANLPALTGAAPTAGAPILASDLTVLRTAVDAARVALVLPPVSWCQPEVLPGSSLAYACDVQGLRDNLR